MGIVEVRPRRPTSPSDRSRSTFPFPPGLFRKTANDKTSRTARTRKASARVSLESSRAPDLLVRPKSSSVPLPAGPYRKTADNQTSRPARTRKAFTGESPKFSRAARPYCRPKSPTSQYRPPLAGTETSGVSSSAGPFFLFGQNEASRIARTREASLTSKSDQTQAVAAFLPAMRPKRRQSTIDTVPRRTMPCTPPQISPAA